jgi:CheY-like chemotaxis protein
MRVLLLNDRRGERDAMVRALPQGAYQVEAVADEQSALAAICRQAPQVLVFSAPAKGGADLVRRLRGIENSAESYLLAVVEATPTNKELSGLVSAGVHDFMRRPFADAELLERVKAPERLLRWSRSVSKPCAFDFSDPLDVSSLRAWRNLGQLVAEDLGQMAGQRFTVSKGWPAHLDGTAVSASIPMSLAGDQLELRLSIIVDTFALAWVREVLLADASASDAATRDALRELANTAGGALKRAALSESVTLTTGLPIDDTAGRFPGIHNCWSLALEGGAGTLAVVGEIRSRANERISAAKLTEGMVVAYDVRNEKGILLVPAGARLTSTSATRLASLLGAKVFIDVAPVA